MDSQPGMVDFKGPEPYSKFSQRTAAKYLCEIQLGLGQKEQNLPWPCGVQETTTLEPHIAKTFASFGNYIGQEDLDVGKDHEFLRQIRKKIICDMFQRKMVNIWNK